MAIREKRSLARPAGRRKGADELQLGWNMDFRLAVTKAMEAEGVTRKELASRLRCSPSQVTRVLGGEANLTLETMARYCAALGMDGELRFSVCEGTPRGVVLEFPRPDAMEG